jgi:acetyltransferase AlgX (SGNH hydrolase-like protein)
MSEGELSARRGWTLTTDAIRAMRDASRAAGAELVVMFVPFKSQVFLPIAVEAMPHDELVSALRYSLQDGRIDVAAMTANRLAQNRMMRRFCADSGIRFLDTTDALAERLGEGVNVYFPDDSHLNEAGHAVVAATLESALRLQRKPR